MSDSKPADVIMVEEEREKVATVPEKLKCDLDTTEGSRSVLSTVQIPPPMQLSAVMLDPAVAILFARMREELKLSKDKLEHCQQELQAYSFTPNSQSGRKLITKCRLLVQENQDLGTQMSSGRIAQLEAELALQRKYNENLKKSQDELNEFIIELDGEMSALQTTIIGLQDELRESQSKLQHSDEAALKPNTVSNDVIINEHKPDIEARVEVEVVEQEYVDKLGTTVKTAAHAESDGSDASTYSTPDVAKKVNELRHIKLNYTDSKADVDSDDQIENEDLVLDSNSLASQMTDSVFKSIETMPVVHDQDSGMKDLMDWQDSEKNSEEDEPPTNVMQIRTHKRRHHTTDRTSESLDDASKRSKTKKSGKLSEIATRTRSSRSKKHGHVDDESMEDAPKPNGVVE